MDLRDAHLYGPGDNIDPESSHVLPALIRRFHEATQDGRGQVVLWGTGTPRREFHVDDLGPAIVHLLDRYDGPQTINVGVGTDVTIRELAETVAAVVGYTGEIVPDTSRPDGTQRKLLDTSPSPLSAGPRASARPRAPPPPTAGSSTTTPRRL